jgi:hypothetical protein
MGVKKTINKFGKFLGKYAGEMRGIVGVLGTIVSALPIGRDDRERVEGILADLAAAADRVEKAANAPLEISLSAADIEAAVAKLLPAAVQAELKRLGIDKAQDQGN